MSEDGADLQSEKNRSFELGHISQLEQVAEDLRERAGDTYARADSHTEMEKASMLKNLAGEYEEQAEKKQERYDEKYKND